MKIILLITKKIFTEFHIEINNQTETDNEKRRSKCQIYGYKEIN